MKTVEARLDIEVFVDCPHCGFFIDLMQESDTDDHNHNEEGLVIGQACPDGYWIDEHKKFEVNDVTCGECKGSFNVKGLEW